MKIKRLLIAVLCAMLTMIQAVSLVRADDDEWSTSSLAGSGVQTVAVDPNNSDVIYVSTYQHGVLVSRDGGQIWKALPELSGNIASILVHTENSDTLYVITSGELRKSQDGGSSWTTLGENVLSSPFWVAAHPLQPNVMYVATQSELFRSSDSGETWSGAGLPVTGGVASVAFDPTNADVIYALQRPQGVFRTDDGGTSWAIVSEGLETQDYYYAKMGVDSTGTVVVQSYEGVWSTSDGGQNWQLVNQEGYPNNEVQNGTLSVDSTRQGKIFLGLRDGILRSRDGGDSWSRADGVLSHPPRLLLPDPQKAGVLYAIVNGQLYSSNNDGDTWQSAELNVGFGRVVAHPTESRIVVGLPSGGYGGPWRSQNGLHSWELRNTGLEDIKVNTLEFNPIDANVLYAGTETGLYRSIDGSDNWERTGLPANVQVSAIAVDEQNDSNLYVGGYAGLLRSTNGGESWTATDLPRGVSSIAVASETPQTVYATANGELYQSQDAGESWDSLEPGGGYITSVTLKQDDQNTIYVGAQDGLYISRDGGADWSRVEVQGGGGNFGPLVRTDPRRPEALYVAWGSKVSISPDAGVNWFLLDRGAPVLEVADLDVDASDPLTLYITHQDGAGGVWQYTLQSMPEPPTPTPSPTATPTPTPIATATVPPPLETATTANALAQGDPDATAELALGLEVDPEATAAQVFGLEAENNLDEGLAQPVDTEGDRSIWSTVVIGILLLGAIVAGGFFVWRRSQIPSAMVLADSDACPNCGATVPEHARFCHKCGHEMHPQE